MPRFVLHLCFALMLMQSFQLSYTVVARCVFVSLMWVVICCMLQYFCCDVWRLRALFNSSGECCCVCHSGQWSSWVQGMCSQQPVIGGVSLPLLFSKYLWCCLYQTYWGAKKWPLGAPSPAYTSFTVLVICICRIQNSGVRISGPYLIQSQVLFELPLAGCCFFWGLTKWRGNSLELEPQWLKELDLRISPDSGLGFRLSISSLPYYLSRTFRTLH